mgnify:CR=1 FL=1
MPLFILSEQHPREQGLKHVFSLFWNGKTYTFRATSKRTRIETLVQRTVHQRIAAFQSNIQENKDWNSSARTIKSSVVTFRATSKRTRIETTCRPCQIQEQSLLSEQHPREQGLKLPFRHNFTFSILTFRATSKRTRIETWERDYRGELCSLSEQHPREQGLKPMINNIRHYSSSTFRATSKRTRIETFHAAIYHCASWSFQSNIQENKDWNSSGGSTRRPATRLSEQHPREQGLKLFRSAPGPGEIPVFQSNIQENKDWNPSRTWTSTPRRPTFRATSKRTRIETSFRMHRPVWPVNFQSNIQENKDWNL